MFSTQLPPVIQRQLKRHRLPQSPVYKVERVLAVRMCPCCKNVSLLLSQQYINCTRVHSLTHAVLIMDMVGGRMVGGKKGAANAVYSCTFCVLTFKGLGFKALFCVMMHIQHIVFTVMWHRAYGKEPFRQREKTLCRPHGLLFQINSKGSSFFFCVPKAMLRRPVLFSPGNLLAVEGTPSVPKVSRLGPLQQGFFYMHHPFRQRERKPAAAATTWATLYD